MNWSKVEIIEQTNDRLVIQETPARISGILFLTLGPLISIVTIRQKEGAIVGTFVLIWTMLLGLYSSVESTFTVERGNNALGIRRSLFGIGAGKGYQLDQIRAVIARKTWRHGEGLSMQFISGKTKSLTLSLHFQDLSKEQLALDHAIRVFRKSRHVSAQIESD